MEMGPETGGGRLSMMVYSLFASAVKLVMTFRVYLYSIMPVSHYYFSSFS